MLPTPCVCTSCGCEWDAEGFYHSNDEVIQPCKLCRCDTSSIYYANNAEAIREKQRAAYYADLDAKRAYFRNYRQARRTQASA